MEDQTKSQNYEYDAWARLKKAWTTDLAQPETWRLEWDYDRLGNRRNQNLTGGQSSVTAPQLTISEATNRITTAGYAYDAAGNMTNDSLHAYTFDAENRIQTVDTTAATYTYSGPLRVKKVASGTTTVYIFSGAKVIAEYVTGALSKEYVYSGGQLLATHEGSTLKYHHPDHLSARVETDGTTAATVRTFGQFPFGEAWYETGTASKWKFTSYERDAESGLDQAVFRYYAPRLGRFASPDPLAGNLGDPQSLNRYGYVQNDPVNLVDPLGLFISGPGEPPCEMDGTCPDPGSGPFSAEWGSCFTFRLDGLCQDRFRIFFFLGGTGGGGGGGTSGKTGGNQNCGVNPITNTPGFSDNPRGVAGHLRPGEVGGQGHYKASRKGGRSHAGIDISAPPGTPIVANRGGKVTFSGEAGDAGNLVIIDHQDGVTTRYAHNTENLVKLNDFVTEGTVIATVGQTGNAEGLPPSEIHVHFNVQVQGQNIDPKKYLNSPCPRKN